MGVSSSPQPSNTLSSAKQELEDRLKAEATPKPTPTSRTTVAWGDYDSNLKTQIDALTAQQDCQSLQSFFGMTTATEQSVKDRTGHGNEALNRYLSEALELARCS
jgi:hypothetical protein